MQWLKSTWPRSLKCTDRKANTFSTCFSAIYHHNPRTINVVLYLGRGWGSDKDSNLPKVTWDCLVSGLPLNCSLVTEVTSLFLNISTDNVSPVAIMQKPCPFSILLIITRCFKFIKLSYFHIPFDPRGFIYAHRSHWNRIKPWWKA